MSSVSSGLCWPEDEMADPRIRANRIILRRAITQIVASPRANVNTSDLDIAAETCHNYSDQVGPPGRQIESDDIR